MLITQLAIIEAHPKHRIDERFPAPQVVMNLIERCIIQKRENQLMKLSTEFIAQVMPTLLEGCLLLQCVCTQRLELVRGNVLYQLVNHAALEHEQRLLELEGVVERRAPHRGRALWRDFDKPVLRKTDECLSHDRATDSIEFCDIPLVQLGSRGQLSVVNRIRDRSYYLLGQHVMGRALASAKGLGQQSETVVPKLGILAPKTERCGTACQPPGRPTVRSGILAFFATKAAETHIGKNATLARFMYPSSSRDHRMQEIPDCIRFF